MRYYYERPSLYSVTKAHRYECDHPVYTRCTLYFKEGRGLAVIQQRYNQETKATCWEEIDPWLVDDIYGRPGFAGLFDFLAERPKGGIFPTITIRQLMWSLRMKPLPKEPWETSFDRKFV